MEGWEVRVASLQEHLCKEAELKHWLQEPLWAEPLSSAQNKPLQA
jgi:hypothetical protein